MACCRCAKLLDTLCSRDPYKIREGSPLSQLFPGVEPEPGNAPMDGGHLPGGLERGWVMHFCDRHKLEDLRWPSVTVVNSKTLGTYSLFRDDHPGEQRAPGEGLLGEGRGVSIPNKKGC